MKKILSLLLATVLMFSLIACGGGGKDDPNLGVYTGTVVDLLGDETPMTEVYPGKNTIELKSGGKATFTLDGDAIDCKWELDGSELVIDIEGTECTGTLKSGTIDLDFMGMMDMTFVKGGSSVPPKPGASTPEKPSTPESSDAGLVGYYKIETLEMDGETMDRSMLEMNGMADSVYLVLDEDGTGRLSFKEEATITYDDSQIYSPAGEGVPYTLDGDTITMQIDNVKMVLVRSDEEPPAPVVPGAFPAAFIEEHSGDWHGMMEIYDATGNFEGNIGDQLEIIARFAFNEDGTCTPFIAAALSGDSGSNFSNLSVTYNEYGELMLLEGEFIDNPIVDSSNIYAMDGVLMMDIYVDDGEGDSMNVVANLRRLDDTWNYDNENPALPEAAVEFYMGKSMEEITELFGIDPDELPAPSSEPEPAEKPDTPAEPFDAAAAVAVEDTDGGIKVTFHQLPRTEKDMEALLELYPRSDARNVSAFFLASLVRYVDSPDDAFAMIDVLRGPQPMSNADKAFMKERLSDKLYLPRAYFEGAVPKNEYQPDEPWVLIVYDDPVTPPEGYSYTQVKTSGADSSRRIATRLKDDLNYLWEYSSILLGIRLPASEDPWA